MTFLPAIIEAVKIGHARSKVQANISSASKQMNEIILLSSFILITALNFFFKYQSVSIAFAFLKGQCSYSENYGHMFQN